jgi:hypothetical protein
MTPMLQLITGWIPGSPRGLPIKAFLSIVSHPSQLYHGLHCKLSMAVETFRNTAGRKPPCAPHTNYYHRRFASASQPGSAVPASQAPSTKTLLTLQQPFPIRLYV